MRRQRVDGQPGRIAVVVAGQGEGASAALSEALASVHRQKPSAALMAEFGPDALNDPAKLSESVDALCKDVCSGGSLGSRLIGCQLRVPTKSATAASLSALLSKLASATQTRRRSVSPRRPGSAAAGKETDNLRILDVRPLLPPACLLEELPREKAGAELVLQSRSAIGHILSGASDRLVVLAGPAVIDQPSAALEYAARLAGLAAEVAGELHIVMKTEIFTTVTPSTGPWPGLLFDPAKDGSYQINRGIRDSREYSSSSIASACPPRSSSTRRSRLSSSPICCRASLSAQSEIGDMASGLSMPAGLRAPDHRRRHRGRRDGPRRPHRRRRGAPLPRRHRARPEHRRVDGQLRLRADDLGGREPPLAAKNVLAKCAEDEQAAVVAECGGHGAVDSDQIAMANAIAEAVAANKPGPRGVALHSYLLAGSQQTPKTPNLIHGLSVTEPCMDWLATEQVVRARRCCQGEAQQGRGRRQEARPLVRGQKAAADAPEQEDSPAARACAWRRAEEGRRRRSDGCGCDGGRASDEDDAGNEGGVR